MMNQEEEERRESRSRVEKQAREDTSVEDTKEDHDEAR